MELQRGLTVLTVVVVILLQLPITWVLLCGIVTKLLVMSKVVLVSTYPLMTFVMDLQEQRNAEDFVMPEYVVPFKGQRELTRFTAEYGIDEWELFYDVKDNRAVFPVRHDGVIVDATGRSLSKRLPKWKRYGKSGLPYTHGCGKVAVVVEDCVSAAVVGGESFVGVAILGTSLQESHKGYLSQFSTAVIALDPDALPKTLQMAKELRGHVNDVRVLRLTDDLKYRNPTDMENLYGIINH